MESVVIFVNLDELSLARVDLLKKHFDLKTKNITLVHCYELHSFMNELTIYQFPSEKEMPEIKDVTCKMLTQKCESLGLANFKVECLFDTSPKQRCLSFLEENKSELCVVFQKPKSLIENVFKSSFATFMNNYAPCDVITIK